MSRITDLKWHTTTLEDLLEGAKRTELFDLVHLELNTGVEFMIAVVSGDQAETAHGMLEKLKDGEHPEAHLMEIATGLTEWHRQRIGKIQKILATPEGTSIQLGEGDQAITLCGEHANGFRAGMQIALEWFEKFPLQMNPSPRGEEE